MMVVDIAKGGSTEMAFAQIMKVAPVMAPATGWSVVTMAALDAGSGSDIWRAILTVGLGIFVALVGVIYRDQNRRMATFEGSLKSSSERMDHNHSENLKRLEKISERQQRFFGLMLSIIAQNPETAKMAAETFRDFFSGEQG